MALVAWSRYTTVRHSTIETSGPPQEVRHTCSGVCVPIIRAPAPPLQCVPSSMAHTGSKQHATDILPFVRGNVNHRGKEKKWTKKRHNDVERYYVSRYFWYRKSNDEMYVFTRIYLYIYIYIINKYLPYPYQRRKREQINVYIYFSHIYFNSVSFLSLCHIFSFIRLFTYLIFSKWRYCNL